MKKKVNFWGILVLVAVLFAFALTGCDMGATESGGGGTTKETPVIDGSSPITIKPSLRAIPTATSTSAPKVLESYINDGSNWYLIDVGYISNMYISKIAELDYIGLPMTVTKTTITENSITNTLTKTITDTITVSDTQNHKVGIEGAWENTFKKTGKFSAKLKYEWSGTWFKSNTSSSSTATSLSSIEKYTESLTTSVKIGDKGEPNGNYRYAMYADCDVYFVISTSLDNQELLSWDTVVCARENSYFPQWEYSAEVPPVFDNSPDGKDISFAEDFYKSLPLIITPDVYKTEWTTIRNDSVKITDSGREKQHLDLVEFNKFGMTLADLKQQGYKTISFYIQLDVINDNKGTRWIFLYNSPTVNDKYLLDKLSFTHSSTATWYVHKEDELKFENIPIDKFIKDEFVIRYGASGSGKDTWENRDLKIQLVYKK